MLLPPTGPLPPRYPDIDLRHQIQVRPFNADKTANMRSLNPEDIDQVITADVERNEHPLTLADHCDRHGDSLL